MWQNYEYIGICIYEHNGDILTDWGSKKGRMTDEGNNIWSYDIAEKALNTVSLWMTTPPMRSYFQLIGANNPVTLSSETIAWAIWHT